MFLGTKFPFVVFLCFVKVSQAKADVLHHLCYRQHENENEVESQPEGTMQDAYTFLPFYLTYAASVPCSTSCSKYER